MFASRQLKTKKVKAEETTMNRDGECHPIERSSDESTSFFWYQPQIEVRYVYGVPAGAGVTAGAGVGPLYV